jgi:hypothetical protein
MPPLPVSSARATARYLLGLRPVLGQARAARERWVGGLGPLIEAARAGDALRAAREAGGLGRELGELCGQARARIDRLSPPTGCERCHAAARAWAQSLLASGEALAAVGGRLDGLRLAEAYLAEAAVQAGRFNAEHARLTSSLRAHLQPARRRHDRLPMSWQAAPS